MNVVFNRRPLYLQVRDMLEQGVASGAWKPGDHLPNEFQLSQTFRVSIGTVRKAVEELVDAKLFRREQGRGTIVNTRLSQDYHDKFDRIRHISGAPVEWRWLAHEVVEAEADVTEAERLQIAHGDPVFRVTRVRAAHARPATIERATLPKTRFPTVPDRSASTTTIASLATQHGIVPGYLDESVRLIDADAASAAALAIEPGTCIILLDRLVHDLEGVPLEWRIAHCHLVDEMYFATTK
jgi:GntR family transcriptional regulator